MTFSVVAIIFLSIISVVNPVCSDNSDSSGCGDAGCFWVPGKCKAVNSGDCTIAKGCPLGCVYTAPVSVSCVDETAVTCAASNPCTDSTNCKMTDGTCVLSGTAPTCEGETLSNFNQCPDGCLVTGPKKACVPRQYGSQGTNCGGKSVTPLTECTYRGGCEWVADGGGKCQSKHPLSENEEDSCVRFNNSVVTSCTNIGICKVSDDGACVFDSENEQNTYCSDEIGPTDEVTECEFYYDCQIIAQNQCEDKEGGSGQTNCSGLGTTPILKCSLEYSGMCSVVDGDCVIDYNGVCSSREDCDDDFCKLDASDNCVFNALGCARYSTEPVSECTEYEYNYCKVAGNECTQKTAEEICAMQSVVKYSECENHWDCKIDNGNCVTIDNYVGESNCGIYSVLKTLSDCSESYRYSNVRCEINNDGACVPHIPVCNLNAAKTGCDSNNVPGDCYEVYQYSCSNVDCSGGDSTGCADIEGLNSVKGGCEWSNSGTCVSKNPLDCTVQGDESCADSNCENIPAVAENCAVGTVTDTSCNGFLNTNQCGGYPGCKWVTTEGSCVEKNCSNSASYATCCTDLSCGYCGSIPRPTDCPAPPTPCESTPSFANCCTDVSCQYCAAASTKPDDCPASPSLCDTAPSYANCCADVSCQYCAAASPKPDDCPTSPPPDSASIICAPILFLISALFLGL